MNVAAGFGSEIVKLVCAFILPRLILTSFGSAYNGITQSISEFISCIALMKAGIGGATKVALYKALANKDNAEISSVVITTQHFMRKVALLFVGFVLAFACIYPIFINTEFDFFFSFSLILIVSVSTFVEYFFGYSYQLLLMADQKEYLLTGLGIFSTILSTVVSVILINGGSTIHVAKIGSALVSLITPLTVCFYTRKKYKIDKNAKSDMSKLPQRWDAVAHEVATFVNNNTDIMVLTIFTNLLEVSVYTVYHAVIFNIKKIIKLSVANFGSAFGDMYAKNEMDVLEDNLGVFELIVNSVVSVAHSTTLAMIVPFVMLYTEGVNDVNYARYSFAAIAVLASVFDCIRMPYKTVVTSIGHFRQTRNGAIFEAVLNITVSVLMVVKFGMIGVAIGTLCAMLFRTLQYSIYLSNKVLNRSLKPFISHTGLTLTIIFVVNLLVYLFMPEITSWLMWVVWSVIVGLFAFALTLFTDYLFYAKYLKLLVVKLLGAFGKKKKA